jgi:hypothetical protein
MTRCFMSDVLYYSEVSGLPIRRHFISVSEVSERICSSSYGPRSYGSVLRVALLSERLRTLRLSYSKHYNDSVSLEVMGQKRRFTCHRDCAYSFWGKVTRRTQAYRTLLTSPYSYRAIATRL